MKTTFYYRILMLSVGLLCSSLAATGQIDIQWDRTIGGNNADNLSKAIPASDGGYLLAGNSYSNASGDKSEDKKGDKFATDYWIVKIDESGNKQWDKTYGGSGYDSFSSAIPTNDGGYLLTGSSESDASGDKTENSKGSSDFWIVKIDEHGNKQWDKTYGGSGSDALFSILSTLDGGYLLAGTSWSNASADKSENSKGVMDFWVVKIDEYGNKQWDKTYGGSGADFLMEIVSGNDGGYLLTGTSRSNASGDKSENSKGEFDRDYWIIKIDEQGNKQWDKTLGGEEDDELESATTADGGYLLAGYSLSYNSADKTETRRGVEDYWIVKVDDKGNKLWDKTLGGNKPDNLYDVITTNDQSYLLAGYSISDISGDKSESNKGGSDYWIVKVDDKGNKLWDKTLGGNNDEQLYNIISTPDGGYLLSGYSISDISGDKSEGNKGGSDYWVVKIQEEDFFVKDLTIINADTDKDVITTREEVIINLTTLNNHLLSVRANTSPETIDSVKLELSGPISHIRVDSSYPYTLFGDELKDESSEINYLGFLWKPGKYELAVTPYFGDTAGSIFTVSLQIVTDIAVESFALINADNDQEITSLIDGDTIDLATLAADKFSIVAATEPETIGSVSFRLSGPFKHAHIENYPPYAIFGDQPAGDFAGRLLPPGKYTLTAIPYEQKNKAGKEGTSKAIHFTVIHSGEIENVQITAFDLYDAVTDQKIMDLTEGSVIDSDALEHEELTVLMHTLPTFVGSVKVELWGPVSTTRIENTKPYALFRNNSSDLFGEVFPVGEYHLKATPYPKANAQGEAGEPLEVSFTVVGGDSNNARLAAYPVPTSGVVNISYRGKAEQANLMLLDFTGQPLLTLPVKGQAQLDLSSYKKGIYYLKVIDQQGVHLQRVVVE